MPGVGTQYITPEGYEQLEKGRVYHLLKSDPEAMLVSMVWFTVVASAPEREASAEKSTPRIEPSAHLLRMDRSSFEEAIVSGAICLAPVQAVLPFWLDGLAETSLEHSDEGRRSLKRTHRDRIAAKLAHIQPMIDRSQEVLASSNPERMLNAQARACSPKVNETRFRLWFFAYLAFGRNPFALHYATQNIGRWSREQHTSKVKRGAPSKEKGKGYGYNASPDMIETILKSYRRLSGLGVQKERIYRRALVRYFGCKSRRVKGRRREFFHPDGKAYPTPSMYWYYVAKKEGKDEVRRTRIGDVRERSENAPYIGSFTSDVCNLMERVQADAYVMKERPRGLVDGSELKPMRVVRFRDERSGAFTAIGFELGGETADAYRMARFCQAIDKVLFCSFLGMVIEHERWPCVGSSPHDVQDRGAGSSPNAFSLDPQFVPPIKTFPPSWSPQSHAVIESSHPRTPSNKDAPSYIKSDKNVLELVRQEVERLLIQNESMDVTGRIPDEFLELVDPPTPNELWMVLDRVGRNDAIPMTFEQAVRAFLPLVPATLERSGICLLGRTFNSNAFDATGFRRTLSGRQSVPVSVHVLIACVRHIWIEVQGRIVQLDMQLPYRAADEELFVSLEQLRERDTFVRNQRRSNEEHRAAVSAEGEDDYKGQTGKEMDGGTRVRGRPKLSKVGQREQAESREVLKGKRA